MQYYLTTEGQAKTLGTHPLLVPRDLSLSPSFPLILLNLFPCELLTTARSLSFPETGLHLTVLQSTEWIILQPQDR